MLLPRDIVLAVSGSIARGIRHSQCNLFHGELQESAGTAQWLITGVPLHLPRVSLPAWGTVRLGK